MPDSTKFISQIITFTSLKMNTVPSTGEMGVIFTQLTFIFPSNHPNNSEAIRYYNYKPTTNYTHLVKVQSINDRKDLNCHPLTSCSIDKNLLLQLPKPLIKALKQLNSVLHVRATARLADRVHTQLRVTQIQRPHAELGAEHRTDGASARRVVAHDKQLQRDSRKARALLQQHDAGRVGRVALVGIDLDHRAAVHGRLVRGLVLARVVGVHRVRHVSRHEEGARERLLVGRRLVVPAVVGGHGYVGPVRGRVAAAREGGEAAQDRGEEVRVGAVGRGRADLLVVEAGYEADGGVVFENIGGADRGDEALDGAIRHVEVVEAGREDELVVEAAEAGLLHVVEDELEVDDGLGLDLGVGGNNVENMRVMTLRHGLERLEILLGFVALSSSSLGLGAPLVQLRRGQSGNGKQLVLLVGVKGGAPIEVDGERRDAQQRLVDLDQLLDKVALGVLYEDSSGDAEVAVEPAVPDAAAVGLDADLHEADVALLGDGLDAQGRGVGVGANHGDGVARLPLLADGEGDDGRAIAGEVVFPSRAQRRVPRVALLDLCEAGLFEAGGGGRAGVVGCGRGAQLAGCCCCCWGEVENKEIVYVANNVSMGAYE